MNTSARDDWLGWLVFFVLGWTSATLFVLAAEAGL